VERAAVGVVGVGTAGSMAMWQLARRGVDVVGFEQYNPGHQWGAAGGDTRWFRTASEGFAYIPMMRRALDLWRELEADAGMKLLDLCGGLYLGPETGDFVTKVLANCTSYDIKHEVLDAAAVAKRFPQVTVEDGEVGVLDLESGQALASVSIAAAAVTAQKMGARLVQHAPVTSVEPGPDGILIRVGEQEWLVDQVVMAVGPWGNQLLPDLVPQLDIQRFAVSWYPLERPEEWTSDRMPIFEREGTEHLFGSWPCIDGNSVKVGFAASVDRLGYPEENGAMLSQAVLDVTDAYVAKYLKGVIPQGVRHVAAMDGYTADRDFLLGPLSADPRIVLAMGHSGHGFKMAPATGKAAADFIVDGTSDADLAPFDPNRFPVRPFLDF
jgi:sarcosine oxidase